MSSRPVQFPCEDITLEGELHLPEENGPFPGVVACHPHPLYGGNMQNNVVTAICQALTRNSIAALRFNFRGVGNSEGRFGGGIAEQEDVRSALAFLMSAAGIGGGRVGLVGYSFGATAAFPVALQDEKVGPLALVSPYLSDSAWEQLQGYRRLKLVVVGDADSIIPLQRFRKYVSDTAESEEYHIVPGADHFWWGHEEELAQRVARFFAASFGLV